MERSEIIITVLKMDEEETKWLKGIMQNPLNDDSDPNLEGDLDKKMRMKFWNALGGETLIIKPRGPQVPHPNI